VGQARRVRTRVPVKRLVDSFLFGFGSAAGAKLFEEIDERADAPAAVAEDEPIAPKPDAKAKARAEKARRKTKARREAEIDRELAALKKRIAPRRRG
jgi:hypothetical protein